jgi:hydroxymethylbilane synthase
VARGIDYLPERARFGTSSIRRAAQVLRLRPDLEIVPFRGNVQTRLQKLMDGVASATLLAMAGLKRVGEDHRVTAVLDPDAFMPAPAQGAIGLAVRANDARAAELVAPLDHAATHSAISAERAMLAVLDGSCRIEDGRLTLKGEILSLDGQVTVEETVSGDIGEAAALGAALGGKLIEIAGPEFLARWGGR